MCLRTRAPDAGFAYSVVAAPAVARNRHAKLPESMLPLRRCGRVAVTAGGKGSTNSLVETLRLELPTDLLDAQSIYNMAEAAELQELMEAAALLRDSAHRHITFSPKVFLPLTRLCRNSCGYCTFAEGPKPGRRTYMTVEEVIEVAQLGVAQGCTEALFTLGDKPELKYAEAAAELLSLGYASTMDYLHHAAHQVLTQTGLIPHINAGVMEQQDVVKLRSVCGSQGLMLETLADRLMEDGGPHFMCPDKAPSVRVSTIDAAGEAAVPFTTGILIGIGETRQERIEALIEIRRLHERYGHIQEVIVQNFRAKSNTAMVNHPEPSLEELLWTVAMARIILGPEMSIQVPPNLSPLADGKADDVSVAASWSACLAAGINDWGGISPVTRDYVNPEKPWPHLEALADATAAAGKLLLPRLAVYPQYALDGGRWLHNTGGPDCVKAAVLRHMDAQGLSRASDWVAGRGPLSMDAGGDVATSRPARSQEEIAGSSTSSPAPLPHTHGTSSGDNSDTNLLQSTPQSSSTSHDGHLTVNTLSSSIPMSDIHKRKKWKVSIGVDGTMENGSYPKLSNEVENLLRCVLDEGHQLSSSEMVMLLSARGEDFHHVCSAADELRGRVNGDVVTYVVNRNVNYTNICTFKCQFCGFSKGKVADEYRGVPYLLSMNEVSRRAAEAWDRGATEVCMQGGIHPDFTGDTYLQLLDAAKRGAPDIHVHAFSPLEVWQGAQTSGKTLIHYLTDLRDAGLGSLPGTAAEVLDDAVRSILCPDKISSEQWIEVVGTAHSVGLRSTSTIMFGHVDSYWSWAVHLEAIRKLQQHTGGITEFVPLPFVHMEAPIYRKGLSRRGPTLRESVLMHAVARLSLHPHITNIQASWVKLGPQMAAQLLASGCNDMGGSIMNESITRAAGATHGQELVPQRMEQLIREVQRVPRQRTTLYGNPPATQTDKSFNAAPLVATI